MKELKFSRKIILEIAAGYMCVGLIVGLIAGNYMQSKADIQQIEAVALSPIPFMQANGIIYHVKIVEMNTNLTNITNYSNLSFPQGLAKNQIDQRIVKI